MKKYLGCWNSSSFNSFNYNSMIGHGRHVLCFSFEPHRALVTYLSWSFRTSFSVLMLTLIVWFLGLIVMFTFLLMLIGKFEPQCFQPNFNQANTPFADAYALSWTTFTTVVSQFIDLEYENDSFRKF